ncbi:LysR family transcriptional regulator [Inquilinus sp. CA228]|uniref:LysR family transcriptional regulator n=1 Tax=Inquilinus sp. CA228 TaxID=3455609 RepID=UPI003F8D0AE3
MVRLKQQPPDLNDVTVFAGVAETASFTAAARTLGIPRATVSRTVARLEAAIGAQLFYRTTRKVELTEIGRAFHDLAARGLALIAEAGETAAATRSEPSGLVRVTAPINFATMALIPWLPEFLAMHPAVRIALRLTDEAVDPLDVRADLAILTGRRPDSSFLTRRLGASRLILVASPAYLGRTSEPRRLADLKDHEFILFTSDAGTETWPLDGPKGRVQVEVTGRISVRGPHAELSAALSGLGIAILPEAITRPYLDSGDLVHLLPDYGREGGEINAVFPANRHQPAALRALLDFLASKMAERSPPRPLLPSPTRRLSTMRNR